MKIGITSDTHGSEDAWEMIYEKFFHDADLILHAGDVLYHGPRNPVLGGYRPSFLAEKLNECPLPIIFSKGNCDSEVDESVLDLPLASPYAFTMNDGLRIVVTHGHLFETDDEKDALAKKLSADIFVSGHTHVGGISRRGGTIFVNPGSPSLSKRRDGRQTIAMIENGTLTVRDIFTGEILDSAKIDKN